MTKMTNSVALQMAIEALIAQHGEDAECVAKVRNVKASIDKKNSYKSENKKPTKTQLANESLKADIVDYLADGKSCTVTDLIKGVETLAEFSNQKVTALTRQLIADNVIVKEVVKGKSYFSLPKAE